MWQWIGTKKSNFLKELCYNEKMNTMQQFHFLMLKWIGTKKGNGLKEVCYNEKMNTMQEFHK